MPEPQIRYVRTEDGVSIAYITIGDGPLVLYCSSQFLSMQHLLNDPPEDAWIGQLGDGVRQTLFDYAGIGASQRDVSDFSLGAQLRATEAVATRMPDAAFTLVGFGAGSLVAAVYATCHPDRVRELVCLFPRPSIITDRLVATMRDDWSLARRRLAGWAYPESVSTQRWFGNAARESMTPEVAAAYCEELLRTEAKEIYRRIPVPTLFCVGSAGQDREDALVLASLVPDCRVATVSNMGDGVASAVLEFMGVAVSGVNPTPATSDNTHRTVIILFTDIVDSTALTEQMGDAAFREKARDLDVELRRIIAEAGGTTIDAKTLGDGVLATFPAATQGIGAATRCAAAGDALGLPLHLGLHAGDVIHEQNNVFGGAVNIASRICGLSAPGEILVSDVVRGMARSSAGVEFEDRGEQHMKGVGEPVRVYAVLGGGEG